MQSFRLVFMTAVLVSLLHDLTAQIAFIPRIQGFTPSKLSYATLEDGREVEGFIKLVNFQNGLIRSLRFELPDGTKEKFMAEQIVNLRVAASELGKLGAIVESAGSAKRWSGTSTEAILKRDFVYYEQAKLPGKKEKYVLLQLVNPGFDSKIKVFDDPEAEETAGIGIQGVNMTGGILKSYYVLRNGTAFLVKKSKYRDLFSDIYGNCPELIAEFPEIKFQDFAEHVAAHEKLCK